MPRNDNQSLPGRFFQRVALFIERAMAHEGGLAALLAKTWVVARTEGPTGLWYRLQFLLRPGYRRRGVPVYEYRLKGSAKDLERCIGEIASVPTFSVWLLPGDWQAETLAEARQSITDQWLAPLEVQDSAMSDPAKHLSAAALRNQLLATTSGEFIITIQPGYVLTLDALSRLCVAVAASEADLFYVDSDLRMPEGGYTSPRYRPAFLPELFLSYDYLGGVRCFRRSALLATDGWRESAGSALEIDLVLRWQAAGRRPEHVPFVLAHQHHASPLPSATEVCGYLAQTTGAVVRAVGEGLFSRQYPVPAGIRVAVVIPWLDSVRLMHRCLQAAQLAPGVMDVKWVVLHPPGTDTAALGQHGVDLVCTETLNTLGELAEIVRNLAAEWIVYLDPRLTVDSTDWVAELIGPALQQGIGMVGGRVLTRQRRVLDVGGVLQGEEAVLYQRLFVLERADATGDLNRALAMGNLAFVSEQIFLLHRDSWPEKGVLTGLRLDLPLFAVGLALQELAAGRRNVYNPAVSAVAGLIRPNALSIDMTEFHQSEQVLLKSQFPELFSSPDPHFNINLAPDHSRILPSYANSTRWREFEPQPLIQEILHQVDCRPRQHREVCLFAHFDAHGQVRPPVLYLLQRLSEVVDVIFISTAENMSREALSELANVVYKAVVRRNWGYDFGSWHLGNTILSATGEAAEGVLLCNDSVAGPLYPLGDLIGYCRESPADVVAATESFEGHYHLQSYFLWFKASAWQSATMSAYWQELGVIHNKQALIRAYELGLSRRLLDAGMSLDCYSVAPKYRHLNCTHAAWRELITEARLPFIKVELLRDNPMGVDLAGVGDLLGELGYPFSVDDVVGPARD